MDSKKFDSLIRRRANLNRHSAINASLLTMPAWLKSDWAQWWAEWEAAKPKMTTAQRKRACVS